MLGKSEGKQIQVLSRKQRPILAAINSGIIGDIVVASAVGTKNRYGSYGFFPKQKLVSLGGNIIGPVFAAEMI